VQGNIAMFERLSSIVNETENCDEQLKNSTVEHLQSLEKEFVRYFPELKENDAILARNPYSASLDVADFSDDLQDQFLDLMNDSSARDSFHEKPLPQFWCSMYESYPLLAEQALRVLLPFTTTYLCESGFSALIHMKTKSRNRMKVDYDMRLALSQTQPRISMLVTKLQFQPSH